MLLSHVCRYAPRLEEEAGSIAAGDMHDDKNLMWALGFKHEYSGRANAAKLLPLLPSCMLRVSFMIYPVSFSLCVIILILIVTRYLLRHTVIALQVKKKDSCL